MGTFEIVTSAFEGAAATYDSNSTLQEEVADRLVTRAKFSRPNTILDIGCGTGHLTTRIAARWPDARIAALDASQAMLDMVARKLPQAETLRCDAAEIAPSRTYDLIFSSMALHWLREPRAALAHWLRLLNPGGRLYLALPVEGSLKEWREVCAAAGVRDGVWSFPPADFADGLVRSSELEAHSIAYRTAREFLDSMKKTGAHTARLNHRPTPPGTLRRLLDSSSSHFIATYRVLYLSA